MASDKDKNLRYGFTTGSCAAAASKAAAYMLLFGKEKSEIEIMTPKGIAYKADILDISISKNSVSCAVKKDSGDDPDVTDGALIYSKVYIDDTDEFLKHTEVIIDGGVGVGRVTMPGLNQEVGNAAINSVPRQMIENEVMQVCEMADFAGKLYVEIYVPDGKKLAEKTFNKRLGIEGGISIIGTTGIVEPMSETALLDTIYVELNQQRALNKNIIAITPGNYGMDFMKKAFGYDLDKSIKCSNFIGDTIDMAIKCGFEKILLTGHIGKLIKLSGGMMNTHSKYGDCRMELLASAALLGKTNSDKINQILGCVSTEAALAILYETGNFENTMNIVMDKIMYHLLSYSKDRIQIECIVYSNGFGLLAQSKNANEFLAMLKEEN